MFSELTYAKIPMAELAGLTDIQLVWVYARKRDQYGVLVRKGSRQGQEAAEYEPYIEKRVSLEAAFRQSKRYQSWKWKGRVVKGEVFAGWTEEDIDRLWGEYLDANPQLKERLARHKLARQFKDELVVQKGKANGRNGNGHKDHRFKD